MLLEKLYSEFTKHTNLIDSVYKSVFINISSILEKIKDISWKSLKYIDIDADPVIINLEKGSKVPRYAVELFQNIFVNSYTLPDTATALIELTYRGVPFTISNVGSETTIPKEIAFIKESELYNSFILNKPVADVFSQFDKDFKFINFFKSNISDIFHPLKKRFEDGEAREFIVENNVSTMSLAETQRLVEEIEHRIKDLLKEIEEIRRDSEKLTDAKNKIFSGIKIRDSLVMDKEKYDIEYKTLDESRKDYADKIAKINDVLKTIDAELSDLTASSKASAKSEREYLIKKKTSFQSNRDSFIASMQDIEALMQDIANKYKSISEELTEIDNYSTIDLGEIDKKLKANDHEQSDSYGIMLSLETELKQQRKLLSEGALKHEKSSSYSDIAIQNVENSSIVNHLAVPLQPSSVITVSNYLRYYFAYYANYISGELLKANPELDPHIANALGSKLVLVKYFGVYFNQLFSAVDFADSRVERVLLITKE
jgi:hypothetical protein